MCMCNDFEKLEWLGTMWQAFRMFLKFHCNYSDVYVFSENSSITKALHMKTNNGVDQQFWEVLKVQFVAKPLGVKSFVIRTTLEPMSIPLLGQAKQGGVVLVGGSIKVSVGEGPLVSWKMGRTVVTFE